MDVTGFCVADIPPELNWCMPNQMAGHFYAANMQCFACRATGAAGSSGLFWTPTAILNIESKPDIVLNLADTAQHHILRAAGYHGACRGSGVCIDIYLESLLSTIADC